MQPISDGIRRFFDEYERSRETSNADAISQLYADTFMFAGPDGSQVITKDNFLKALPRRQEFVKAVGLMSSKIQRLEENRLDEHYILVRGDWLMRFNAGAEQQIVEGISATYLLYQQGDNLQIVFQLDHQDLTKRIKALGLVPPKG